MTRTHLQQVAIVATLDFARIFGWLMVNVHAEPGFRRFRPYLHPRDFTNKPKDLHNPHNRGNAHPYTLLIYQINCDIQFYGITTRVCVSMEQEENLLILHNFYSRQ